MATINRKKKKTAKKKVSKKMGRPEKIDQEKVAQMIGAIQVGANFDTAASYVGISKDTLHRWLKKGARDREAGLSNEYVNFSDSMQKAVSEAQLRDLKVVDDCANGEPEPIFDKEGKKIGERIKKDWRASAWRLERRFPEQWNRKQSIHIDDKPINNQESYEQYIERISKDA